MSITSIQSNPQVISPQTPSAPPAPKVPVADKPVSEIQADSVEVKKSALNGALRGGLTAAGAIAVPGLLHMGASQGIGKVLATYLMVGGAAVGGLTGAVAGAVASQMTDSPWKGAVIGAITGAATGAAVFGGIGRSLNGAGTGAAVGAVAGLIGGVAGSFATEKK